MKKENLILVSILYREMSVIGDQTSYEHLLQQSLYRLLIADGFRLSLF